MFLPLALTTVVAVILVHTEDAEAQARSCVFGPPLVPTAGEHWMHAAVRQMRQGCPPIPQRKCTKEDYPTLVAVPVCDVVDALGMEDMRIPDANITASSFHSTSCPASLARLNSDDICDAWVGAEEDTQGWLQIAFVNKVHITQLVHKGSFKLIAWIVEFEVQYSDDGQTFETMSKDGTALKFYGNVNKDGNVTTILPTPLYTKYIRILATVCQFRCAISLELYGCYD